MLTQNLLTAIEELWANKLRSLLTVLGIIIAVTSTIVVVAVVQGFSTYIADFLQGLGTNAMWVFPERPPGSFYEAVKIELTEDDLDDVGRSCPAVGRVSPYIVRQAEVKRGNLSVDTQLIGTSPEFQDIRNFYVRLGRFFSPVEMDNRRNVCVLGSDLVGKLRTDDSIVGQYVIINQQRFRVLGVLERKGSMMGDSMDNQVLIPGPTAIKMFPDARRYLGFMAQSAEPLLVPEAKAQIINVLRRRHRLGPNQANDFRIFTQDEILREFNRVSVIGASVLVGIVGVSLLVGGIGIMNVMLVSVTERTREIGLRKAVGARRRDILAQFLTEAIVLSLMGGILGISMGYGLTYLASLHPSMVDISVPLWAVGLGVGFSVLVGVVFGLLPAFKAAILQPIEALRYE